VLEAWGWRLAFLAALPLGLTGLYLRLRLDETPPFRDVQQARALAARPITRTLRAYPGRVTIGFGLVAAASLTFNTFFIFLPSHLVSALHVPQSRIFGAALLGLALVTAASPALGQLSDRIGRKPLLAAGTLALLALTLPAYLLICRGGPVGLLFGYLLVGAALSCSAAPHHSWPRCWSSAPATSSSRPSTPPPSPWPPPSGPLGQGNRLPAAGRGGGRNARGRLSRT
jgi:MHS family proline/betaine transporter-like MFS transporter